MRGQEDTPGLPQRCSVKTRSLLFLALLALLLLSCDDDTPKPSCRNHTCPDNQVCSVGEDGALICACPEGYMGEGCTACAQGYQDNDLDGICKVDCMLAELQCPEHASCDDSSGTATCACNDPYIADETGTCIPNGSGESCEEARLIRFNDAPIVGDTRGAPDTAQGSCVESESTPDHIYFFTLTQSYRVRFQVSGFDTVLYLRSTCDDSQTEFACDDDSGGEMGSLLELDLEPGSYFLFVDGYASSGTYTLEASRTCSEDQLLDPSSGSCVPNPCIPDNPCTEHLKSTCTGSPDGSYECSCDPGAMVDPEDPSSCIVDTNPTGESCGDAILLSGSSGSVSGETTSAANDYTYSCGGTGPDRVYVTTLTEESLVTFQVVGYDTVLALRSDCLNQNDEVDCNDDDPALSPGSSISRVLPPGTYYLFVDAYNEGGDYTLTWSINPNPCANEEAACPGTPQCVPSADWSNHTCVCPEGTLPHNGSCVDNPCDPNPCQSPGRKRCEVNLPNSYSCSCEVGYMDHPTTPNSCVEDPSAAEWAFVVFLNADNNLESYGITDVDEMTQVGSTGSLDVVTLIDHYSHDNGDAKLLYVNAGSTTEVQNYGELDMSDWTVLRDFGLRIANDYPARHYAFVLWDHGDGWSKKGHTNPSPLFKGFSTDDHGGNGTISIAHGDYAMALSQIVTAIGRKIDILAFDACLMGMWEVAEATKPFANYLVASSETIPADGYPYHTLLAPLANDTTLTPNSFATALVDAYYYASSSNATLTLTDLEPLGTLTTAVDALAQELMNNTSLYPDIENLRAQSQRFTYESHVDLYDFASRITTLPGASQALLAAANAVLAAMDQVILHHRAQSSYANSHGLAIYLPPYQDVYDHAYEGTGAIWSHLASWNEFVADFAQ